MKRIWCAYWRVAVEVPPFSVWLSRVLCMHWKNIQKAWLQVEHCCSEHYIARILVFVVKNCHQNIVVTNGKYLIDFMLSLLIWLTQIVLAKIFHFLKIVISQC